MANWLDKYDEGGDVSKYIATKVPKTFGKNVAAVDSTVVNKVLPKDPRKLKVIHQAEEDAKIAKERRARINKSISPEAMDWNKPSEDLALQTSATADKLRFSDYPNWFDDSMINPVPTFGPMVSGLGRIPLEISQGNYGQAALNLAAPVAAGAGEAVAEMLLKPITDPLMAYGKDVAKKYVLNPAVRKLNSVLGRQASVPSMGPYIRPNHAIDDLSGTNIGRNISQDFGIDELIANNPKLVDFLKLPLYQPGSGGGLFPTTAKTSKEFLKLMYDKKVSHLYQRNKLMHGCGSAAECAKIANAITSTVNRQVSPDDVFDYSASADDAWYTTSQMLRNNGELIYNEGLHGPLTPEIKSRLQVGDQIMMGPDTATPHAPISPATGNFKEPNVNHRATTAGIDPDGNVIINESFDGRLVGIPLQNNVYYNNNSNLGIRSIVRPAQFVDKAGDIAKRAVLNDVNLNTGTMEFGVSPELQAYKEVYDKIKPTLIGNLGIHADEADQIFRHVLGIGIQESKMSGKLAKGLPKAKVIIQDKLREAGLTKPVKEVINAIKRFGNRKYEANPDLLDFPGNSKMQMEASKLAEKEGIDVKDALEQLYTTTYNRPKPFALSDTDPSVGAFRQKHLSKTAERLGLTESDFKLGRGNKNSFYNNPENELTSAFANFYDLKKNLAKKHPDWDQQKLFDMATLSWNSPSKANNDELVKYFYDFADNSKFEGFDYLNKVKDNIKTHTPLKSITPTSEVKITKPFLQFEDGGWLDKYNDGGPVQENYNDASASYPPNFVGQGYDTTGRNYSPAWGGQFEDGGEIIQTGKKIPFDQWYKTVPKTKNDTINYNLRRAYELAPQKDLDAFVKNPNAHLMTAYENPETGIYEFMKSKHHSTINKELDWYNGKKGKDFRNNYDLDTTGDFYRYVPKQMADGGDLSFIKDTKLRNMLEGYKPEFMDAVGDYRLPEGYAPPFKDPSSEVSTSVGGEGGEPAYLIPTFKYGQRLNDYVGEFNMTGQHIGGPFKTVEDAEKFGELRHQYVGDGKTLPSPIATSNMAMGGSLPGASGHFYARYSSGGSAPGDADYNAPRNINPAPHNGPGGKKTIASAQNGMEMKYYQEGLDWKPKTISKNGSQLIKLDQLTNFTNYNTKQPGGWLDKYQD